MSLSFVSWSLSLVVSVFLLVIIGLEVYSSNFSAADPSDENYDVLLNLWRIFLIVAVITSGFSTIIGIVLTCSASMMHILHQNVRYQVLVYLLSSLTPIALIISLSCYIAKSCCTQVFDVPLSLEVAAIALSSVCCILLVLAIEREGDRGRGKMSGEKYSDVMEIPNQANSPKTNTPYQPLAQPNYQTVGSYQSDLVAPAC